MPKKKIIIGDFEILLANTKGAPVAKWEEMSNLLQTAPVTMLALEKARDALNAIITHGALVDWRLLQQVTVARDQAREAIAAADGEVS